MIGFRELDPRHDAADLISFLTSNSFPYHVRPSWTDDQARQAIDAGRFWSDDHLGFWVEADSRRIGLVVLDDLSDIDGGGNPLFDLRLAEASRGSGLGTQVLRELTAMVFDRFPTISRFEGQTREDNVAMRKVMVSAGFVKEAHYRDGWPVDGAPPKASVGYAILRRDWESGTTTTFVWDDLGEAQL
jgi:RimJ/RimL family protein N-acetyltransferase